VAMAERLSGVHVRLASLAVRKKPKVVSWGRTSEPAREDQDRGG